MARRLVPIALCSLTAACCLGVAPALAAPTRAEYIAQADPVCQSFVEPESASLGAYHRDFKSWLRAAKKGSIKRFARLTHRLAAALLDFDRVHSSMTEQVAAIQPPDADASLIGIWLNGRRQADVLSDTAAAALNRFRVRRFFTLIRKADNVEGYGTQAINGYGFHVCGISA